MTLTEASKEVGKQVGLPSTMVAKIYKSYWKAVREHITSLPLMEDLSDEEFAQLQPNINIPSIGKLCVTLDRYKRMKRSHQIIMKATKNKKERYATHQEN